MQKFAWSASRSALLIVSLVIPLTAQETISLEEDLQYEVRFTRRMESVFPGQWEGYLSHQGDRLVVRGWGPADVMVISTRGDTLFQFDQKGGGPGEILGMVRGGLSTSEMSVVADDTRYHVFDEDFEFKETYSAPGMVRRVFQGPDSTIIVNAIASDLGAFLWRCTEGACEPFEDPGHRVRWRGLDETTDFRVLYVPGIGYLVVQDGIYQIDLYDDELRLRRSLVREGIFPSIEVFLTGSPQHPPLFSSVAGLAFKDGLLWVLLLRTKSGGDPFPFSGTAPPGQSQVYDVVVEVIDLSAENVVASTNFGWPGFQRISPEGKVLFFPGDGRVGLGSLSLYK